MSPAALGLALVVAAGLPEAQRAITSSVTSSLTSTRSVGAASPSSVRRQRLVVLSLRADEKLRRTADRLTEALLVHLGRRSDLSVLGETELGVLVAHDKDKHDLQACGAAPSCLAELTKAAEAEQVITGHLGALGGAFTVTLSRWDPARAASDRAESATGDTTEELLAATLEAADRLLGPRGAATASFQLAFGASTTKIAVLNLAAYEVSPELAENLTQILALELRRHEALSVISRDEIKLMLAYEAEKQIVQCKNDVACLIEIGGALGVEYLITGALGSLEDTWVVYLKLMKVAEAEVVHRVSESFRGPERQLVSALRIAVGNLLGRPVAGQGSIELLLDVDEGSAAIDEGAPFSLPARSPLELASGKHALSIRAEGYVSLDQDFYVEPGQLTKIRPELIEAPRPWYSEWWAWAVIGSAVAAGITLSAIVATDSPSTGTVFVAVPPRGQ